MGKMQDYDDTHDPWWVRLVNALWNWLTAMRG